MTPLGVFARGTPGARTPDTGVVRISGDGHASRAVARALLLLVDRIEAAADESDPVILEALRGLTARSREGALLLRMLQGAMVLEGVPLGQQGMTDDPALERLRQRLLALGVGSLTIREGAAPGELLTLGRWIAKSPTAELAPAPGDTPISVVPVHAASGTHDHAHDDPREPGAGVQRQLLRELLRSWSVLVTPAAVEPPAELPGTASAAAMLTRLAAARSDVAASSAIAGFHELLDIADARGDAATIEGIARACLAHLRVVGSGGGRVAVESALRRLLHPRSLALLARRLPSSAEPAPLLQLFARAGDSGVATLVERLLQADDPSARRSYFDAIVAMDVGASQLFASLSDPRWFVVRNAAALLGEMGVEQADVPLLPLLVHADERIRIAVARALVRLRTPKALAALHGAVDDAHPEVRRIAASAYGLAGSLPGRARPSAGRLSAALDREEDEDVALEMLAALGRLGSSDAVQRLLRIALPVATDMTGAERGAAREAWVRIAALEALVRARGHALAPAIEGLLGDGDPEVAAAAQRLYAAVSDR